ncbi:hypothetical protein RF11_10161 [Thelohanellus kitauei]|uniref:Uncharacterized protein n=1 Tax=Thelohanellus kitauei TaxID=669202 RepID=A0A0C2MNW5_THEKT|nr:hypothetical protein RF11_10161 [Thelohanellus kitauei]
MLLMLKIEPCPHDVIHKTQHHFFRLNKKKLTRKLVGNCVQIINRHKQCINRDIQVTIRRMKMKDVSKTIVVITATLEIFMVMGLVNPVVRGMAVVQYFFTQIAKDGEKTIQEKGAVIMIAIKIPVEKEAVNVTEMPKEVGIEIGMKAVTGTETVIAVGVVINTTSLIGTEDVIVTVRNLTMVFQRKKNFAESKPIESEVFWLNIEMQRSKAFKLVYKIDFSK